MGQSYGILPVPPTPSILGVRPIAPVPNWTSGTFRWNPTCPTNTLNPMCLSHLSHLGQVGQFYGILPIPPSPSILCVRPIIPVPCRTSGTVLWNPACSTITLNPMCPSYPTCPEYDKWDSPMESCLSHQHRQSYVSVLSHLSHVGQRDSSIEFYLPTSSINFM